MITVKTGDMFNSKTQTLVNTVNCVGVMGKGIALEFKQRFPDMYDDYVKQCNAGHVKLGRPYLYKSLIPPWILNFPTKDHWRSVSKLSDITEGMNYLRAHYKEWGIKSIAVPPLGCGQGQLDWTIVGPTLYRILKEFDISVELFAPYGTSEAQLDPSFLDKRVDPEPNQITGAQIIGPGWIAIVEVLRRIQEEPYHWEVGRTRFQKIAYFVTETGLPTGLKYQRGSYGPYSSELKSRITKLVNNGLITEEKLGRMLAVHVGPTFKDAREMYANKIEEWEAELDKIVDLFTRTDTRQSEIVATVHFATKELKSQSKENLSEDDVLTAVMDWKQNRRPPIERKDVALAIRHMNMLSWIGVAASKNLPLEEREYLEV